MTGDNGVSPKDSPSNIELEEMLDGLLNAANDEENAGGMTFAERSAAGMGTNGESQKQEAAEDDEPDQPKVELDLDDAPFLEEEEIIKPPIQEAHTRAALAANEENDQDEDPGGLRGFLLRLRKNKKRLAMASALAIFILAAPLVFLLLSGDKEAALPEQPNQAQAPQPPPTTPPAVLDNRFV
mgnify:CR=1 FL=1